MTTATKFLLLIVQNKKVRNTITGVIIGTIISVVMLILLLFCATPQQNAVPLATAAETEYAYWQSHSPGEENLSCQGERYCGYFNSPVVDWCCYFVGYCIDKAGYECSEFGFSPGTISWINNLEELGKLRNANTYTPQVGNLIFFNYSGRSNFAVTHNVDHIGIVTAVETGTVTIIAGNEHGGETSNWANVSCINKYTLPLSDDSIACYGAVGASTATTGLTNVTRNIITHNEVGVFYDELENSDFGSVIANDNGALSIGAYGWHGNKALELLRTAYSISNAEISRIASSYSGSGQRVLDAIKYGSDWSNFIPDSRTCSCIKSMLLTNAGIAAQDQTSAADAQQYILICKENNITDKKVIVYCSDILNQYGTASFDKNVYGNGHHGVLYGITPGMSLDTVYSSGRAWSDSNYNYESRRRWTYNYLKSLPYTDLN